MNEMTKSYRTGVTLQMYSRGRRKKNIQLRHSTAGVEIPGWNISGDVGLVSAGRINKDTPPLTTPGHTSRASAMDISSHIFQIGIHGAPGRLFRPTGDPRPVRYEAQRAYLYSRKMREGKYRHFLARILT